MVRQSLLALAVSSLLVGCTTPDTGDAPGGSGSCSTDRLNDLIGRPASMELGVEAQRLSGAQRLRWIRPGDMVTMDYSPDRLNIHLDASHRVERFACG